MSKNERTGQLRPRNSSRELKLGYYYIVTDTKATEKNYFEGLRDSLPVSDQKQIKIQVVKSPACNFVKKCREFLSSQSQYADHWIVFDRDEEKSFDKIISEATTHKISVGWSNPCIEIWFLAYFGKMPTLDNSQKCISTFAKLFEEKTGQKYQKADPKLYDKLLKYGDEKRAIAISQNKQNTQDANCIDLCSERYSCTTLHELVEKIRNKISY